MSSVRGDGALAVQTICARRGWGFNGPYSSWLTIDEEVQRLARSSVNVCWYHTSPIWKNRASAPSMLLASGRPLLINHDSILAHLWEAPDVYHAGEGSGSDLDQLDEALMRIERDWEQGQLRMPTATAAAFSWTAATRELMRVWAEALR
jgi:hypothetical protein